ncbi:MAG: aminoglycoside phosphotransferase family protein [Pseudomonadota bacterium]
MIEKLSILNQHIIDCLQNAYGIEFTVLTPLLWGADINASVYKALATDKSTYFVKLKRGKNHNISVRVIELLENAGIRQIIPIIKTTDGLPIQAIGDDFTLCASPFIEWENGLNRDLSDSQWRTLGKVMRKIHDIKAPFELQMKIRKESYAFKWGEIVRSLYRHIECQSIKSRPINDEIAVQLELFMIKYKVTIFRLIDAAEKLVQQIRGQPSQFVLCHSDIHAGNVLIDENDGLYILDWDDPIRAPKERDLMFIGGGVANAWNKLHEEELFYKSYGKTEVNRTILAYYRHARIVEDIALYGQQMLLTKVERQTGMIMYKQFVDQFNPNGVVDIVLKSAEPHV